MNFAERAAVRKKTKEIKNKLKELQKALVASGEDKGQVTTRLKVLQEILELGGTLRGDYEDARMHLKKARESLVTILDYMGESPIEEVQESLKRLIVDLEGVYHPCLIHEEDTDYKSTVQSLKQMVEQYSEQTAGIQRVMLRSELENVKSVLDDTVDWHAPEFLALAYYVLYGDKALLKDMENEQRNLHMRTYLHEQYLNAFMEQCTKAGVKAQVQTMIQEYIYAA